MAQETKARKKEGMNLCQAMNSKPKRNQKIERDMEKERKPKAGKKKRNPCKDERKSFLLRKCEKKGSGDKKGTNALQRFKKEETERRRKI